MSVPGGNGGPEAPEITVIIATRNRAEQLKDLLARLALQQTGGRFAYEILVVDNGSTDQTRHVVEETQSDSPVPLRYAYEGRAGKPWALNTGLREARGEILVFTDDDVLAEPSWLQGLWTCFAQEQADAVTGRVLPLWVGGRPEWLTDEAFRQIGGMGCIDYGPERAHSVKRQDCRWVGGNMAIRRRAAERIGGFDPRMLRGQDTEYYRRSLANGLQVVYEPAALVYHRIPAERLTPRYFRQWRDRSGYYQAYLIPWKLTHAITILPLWHYRKLASLCFEWARRTLARRPWWERFNYELFIREELSLWRRRIQLLPMWWLTLLTGRSHLP